MNDAKYIGLDVHQATISVAVLDSAGQLAMEAILETKAETILQFIHSLRGSLRVTFEEGTCAAWLHDLLAPPCRHTCAIMPVRWRIWSAWTAKSRVTCTALLKAQTALRLREPTSIRGTQMLNAGRALPRNTSPNMFNFCLASGGIPIVVEGQMIGAVGVSGVDAAQDENCVIEGLQAAFGDHATLPVYSPAAPGARPAPAPGTPR